MANGDRKLPGWAAYIISGLAGGLLLSVSANATFAIRDRETVARNQEEFRLYMNKQNEINVSIKGVLDQMCFMMTMNQPDRMNYMKNYPLMLPKPYIGK